MQHAYTSCRHSSLHFTGKQSQSAFLVKMHSDSESEIEDFSTPPTTPPQRRPIAANQVQGRAGGFVFQATDTNRLRRFLCLGSEGGTYYTNEKELGLENARAILRLIDDGKGQSVVETIVEYSVAGRTAKQNPILFALALCARSDNVAVKKLAYESVSRVCRIPTHLFAFVDFCEKLSGKGTGWGRAHRRAISTWYNEKDPKQLAMAVTKYRQREGWSHRDLARLSHLKPCSNAINAVIQYAVKGMAAVEKTFVESTDDDVVKALRLLHAVEEAKTCDDDERLCYLIRDSGLVREHIPSAMLNNTQVIINLIN